MNFCTSVVAAGVIVTITSGAFIVLIVDLHERGEGHRTATRVLIGI
jgi:hypothetical protein